jgi:endonuclease-3
MLHKIQIKTVLTLLKNHYSNTTTALKYRTPFQLLISTMLAAQSTDKRVNIVTRDLFQEFPDARAFLRLDQSSLEGKIKTVGLYKSKARHILATCRILVDEYHGEIPKPRKINAITWCGT